MHQRNVLLISNSKIYVEFTRKRFLLQAKDKSWCIQRNNKAKSQEENYEMNIKEFNK